MRGSAFKSFSIHWRVVFIALALCLMAGAAFAQSPPAKADESKIIATVLGHSITAKDKERMNGMVVSALIQKFARDHGVAVTEQEIDTFIERTALLEIRQIAQLEDKRKQLQAELKDSGLTEPQRKKKEKHLATMDQLLKFALERKQRTEGKGERERAMKRRMASHFVNHWKINKALFNQYGGRVIFQQAGAEPVDAYRDFLREQEKVGAFKILDPALADSFWRYFTNDAMHSFYSAEEGAKFINTPWWMLDPPPLK